MKTISNKETISIKDVLAAETKFIGYKDRDGRAGFITQTQDNVVNIGVCLFGSAANLYPFMSNKKLGELLEDTDFQFFFFDNRREFFQWCADNAE